MRIYRDLDLVESLGSGIPRILRAYGRDCFSFTDNFVRITLPISKGTPQRGVIISTEENVQVSVQVKSLIISISKRNLSVDEILKMYKQVYKQVYKSHWYFKKKFISPAMQQGWIEMQYPDKPNHLQQKYRLTERGMLLLDTFIQQNEQK